MVAQEGVGIGGCCPGGACGIGSGGRDGNGEESNDQHEGKVWRFEALEGNVGIGVDSSEEKLGLVDIAGTGFGDVVESEERSRVGTEE